MADREAVSAKQRDALFERLRDDPKFRDAMKKDWRAAIGELKIDPKAVAKGTLSRKEIGDFLNQRAGWTIEIVFFNRLTGNEQISLGEAVNFEARE